MPCSDCYCVVCQKKSNSQNICGHLMTHKKDLTPFVLMNSVDTFSTVKGAVEGASQEYYCCFGCKKQHRSKVHMRDHMKTSDECVQKHLEFLRDIGYTNVPLTETIELRRENRSLRRELREKDEQIQDLSSGNAHAETIKSLQRTVFQQKQYINMVREHIRYVPSLMIKPEINKYCNDFVSNYKKIADKPIPGEMKSELRRAYLEILQRTPELQFYLIPDFNFLENQHCPNGEYQSIFGDYFNRLDYKPRDTPYGDYEHLPSLPPVPSDKDVNQYLSKFM